MNDDLKKLETRIGHRFSDVELLVRALTHSSAAVMSALNFWVTGFWGWLSQTCC